MDVQLRHPLCAVLYRDGLSFGGSQMQSPVPEMVRCGCGIVAAQEVLLYLCRYHGGNGDALFSEELLSAPDVSAEVYNRSLDRIRARYLPLIPHIGVNGIGLILGMNAAFRRCELPFSARWAISSGRFYPVMEEMLEQDIPVIFSVGPNFPVLWGREKVGLRPDPAERHTAVQAISAHYMIAVGLDAQSIHVSSWGKRFAVDREEYDRYVKRFSSSLVSNLVAIRRK